MSRYWGPLTCHRMPEQAQVVNRGVDYHIHCYLPLHFCQRQVMLTKCTSEQKKVLALRGQVTSPRLGCLALHVLCFQQFGKLCGASRG